ncbi:MAG TPA: BatA domain-containing protein [Gemmatimonadaceae bacterium]|nr:BatA domain-containing protein [Gemmatimonadaceae bacterium]
MGFLVPAFLAGFVAVVVPIVLHLRHRDKDTPHRFPSLMFVERLPIRTAQRRRITDWPLLLLRALAITLLVLAFARPLWSRPGVIRSSQGDRTVIVLLDRSMSMGHTGVWPRAVEEARRAIAGLGTTDRVALVLFDDEAEIAQALTTDKNLALAALANAKTGTAGTRFAAGLRAARQIATDARTGSAPIDVVLVTDMQRSGLSGLAGLEIPSTMRVRTVGLSPTTPRANASVAVTEARPIANAGRERLAVTAHVTSRSMGPGRPMTAMLRLNGRPSGTRVLTVNATGDTKIAFEPVAIPVGLVRGEVTIDADSLAADDTARFTLTSNDEVRVLLVAPDDAERDETLYIERALAVGRAPSVRLQRVRPSAIDADELRDVALVLLWDSPLPNGRALDALRAWTTRGGGLVQLAGRRLGRRSSSATLLPASVSSVADRSDDRGGSLGDVRIDHPLLAPFRETPAALVAPRFLRHARLDPANGGEVVARFDDGSAAIVERTEGTGRVIELGMPLDARAGDFPLQPAYVPFVRRLVLYATGRAATPLARGTGESWLLPAAAREPVVSTPDGSIVRPTRDSRATSVPLRTAGIYALHDGQTRGTPVAELAVNTPAAESDLATITDADLLAGIRRGDASTMTSEAPPAPAEIERRQGLWRIVIGVLVVLLLLEMLMASRGWRAVANPVTSVPSSGEGS